MLPARCHMWVEFVVVSCLAPKVFFMFSSFYPYAKTNMSKFQSNLDRGPAWKPAKADVASSLNTEICYELPFSRIIFILMIPTILV